MLIWALRNKSDERRKSRKSTEQLRAVRQGTMVYVFCDLLVVRKAKYPSALPSNSSVVECSLCSPPSCICGPSWPGDSERSCNLSVAVAWWCRPPTRELVDFGSGDSQTTEKRGLKSCSKFYFSHEGSFRSVPSEFSGLELLSHLRIRTQAILRNIRGL